MNIKRLGGNSALSSAVGNDGLGDFLINHLKNNNIDIISVDPPRKGLDKKVVDTIIKSNIKKVVYVSCNGATLTRDLKYFIDSGFELKKVKLCDMFSKTAHCEVVVLIEMM